MTYQPDAYDDVGLFSAHYVNEDDEYRRPQRRRFVSRRNAVIFLARKAGLCS